ncbi:MAG: sugar phosphate nucleotidyltransferase, partial [Nocardioidaceae bacterium]
LVLNGDQLSGHDAAAQVRRWRDRRADVCLHLVEVPDPRAYGCVPTDDDGRVTAFLEKSPDPVTRQVNAGCYVFRRSVIEEIPPGTVVSVERETFPEVLRAGRLVTGYVEPCYWLDVGTPAAVAQASRDIVTGTVSTPAYAPAPAERLVDPGARIDPTAVVRRGSSVGPRATVGARAVVDGSVIMPGATVLDGAVAVDSVVGHGASLGAGAVVRDAAVGDDAVVGERCELLAGARLACGARLEAGSLRFSAV